MFRVISREDDLGGAADEIMKKEEGDNVKVEEEKEQQVTNTSLDDDNRKPPFVVADDPMEGIQQEEEGNAPIRIIGEKSGYQSSNSSLSGDEEDDEDTNMLVTLCDEKEQEVAQPNMRRKQTLHRLHSTGSASSHNTDRGAASSQNSSRDWGWFEDVHLSESNMKIGSNKSNSRNKAMGVKKVNKVSSENDASAMAVTAPTYVLEESLSSQRLWKESAGQRPPQPVEERAFFEKMWAQNFARSQVNYNIPVEVLTASSPISLNPFADGNFDAGGTDYTCPPTVKDPKSGNDVAEAALVHRMNDAAKAVAMNKKIVDSTDGELTIVVRGDNVFGTTVSKSFARCNENGDPIPGRVDTINISVASYRVVESKHHGKYAQFLVIYREGSIRDTVGIWKRYSDFEELAHKVTHAHDNCAATLANISPLAVAEEPETEHLPNAITSWRLLKKRKRWYRCLDAGYLSLKVFLLERFLHDILFESTSPQLLRDFVGVDSDMF